MFKFDDLLTQAHVQVAGKHWIRIDHGILIDGMFKFPPEDTAVVGISRSTLPRTRSLNFGRHVLWTYQANSSDR